MRNASAAKIPGLYYRAEACPSCNSFEIRVTEKGFECSNCGLIVGGRLPEPFS